MVVATGVTCSVRSGADSSIVEASAAPPPLEEIDPAWLALSHRRGCGDCVVVGALEAGAQPSLLAAAVVVVVDPAGAASAGAVTCASDAPAITGIAGIVPIESSYTGRFASFDFAWRGAGRVVYALVTIGSDCRPDPDDVPAPAEETPDCADARWCIVGAGGTDSV